MDLYRLYAYYSQVNAFNASGHIIEETQQYVVIGYVPGKD